MDTWTWLGPLATHTAEIQDRLADARAFIGHARLSTSGPPTDPRNNQPLRITAQLAIAHNGNVYDAAALTARYALPRETDNDSEVLGQLLRAGSPRVDWRTRVDHALAHVPPSPLALLVLTPAHLVATVRGLPLHWRSAAGSVYVCSRAFRGSVPARGRAELTFAPGSRTAVPPRHRVWEVA